MSGAMLGKRIALALMLLPTGIVLCSCSGDEHCYPVRNNGQTEIACTESSEAPPSGCETRECLDGFFESRPDPPKLEFKP